MGFWGIQVKPGKPHPYHSDNVQGRLCVTQATLGLGSSKERCILGCSVGHNSPIFLCSLLPDKLESCSLSLEFEDELVAFSIIGKRSIHLSGYFVSNEGDQLHDEHHYDSGEDISETETRSSGYDYSDEYDSEFIDDADFEIFSPSEVRNSGVVIEEILDDDEPASENDDSKSLKKSQVSEQEDENAARQEIISKKACCFSVFESEDEDGLPISPPPPPKSKSRVCKSQEEHHHIMKDEIIKEEIEDSTEDANIDVTCKKRKSKSSHHSGQLQREKKKKKKKNKEEDDRDIHVDQADDGIHINIPMVDVHHHSQEVTNSNDVAADENGERGQDPSGCSVLVDIHHHPQEVTNQNCVAADENGDMGQDPSGGSVMTESLSDGKKRKKKKKPRISTSNEMPATLSSHVRTYANGLSIEEQEMGEPNGKRADRGKQVSVSYIGRLMKTGMVFDSNVGRAPYKFRLGVGQVIKGWDVGVVGMRIGDKRRVKIPPSMGYGEKGAGSKIPPNSWLEFDIELINVY